MKSSIVPLSAAPAELVEQYLTQPGIGRGYSGEEVRWKYFDEQFSQGRERGYVWLKLGQVRGFIGMIPAKVAMLDDGERDLIWTCDWSVENPQNNPGIGIRLLTKVHKAYDLVAGVGGTEDTRSIVPRINTLTIADAAVVLRRPLRLRPFLERVEQAAPFALKLSRSALANIPLPIRRGPAATAAATMSAGVSRPLASLFIQPAKGICSVAYDARHLAWLSRSPAMQVQSCYLASGDGSAGAVFWRRHCHPTRWRLTLRSGHGGEHLLEQVLARVLEWLRDHEAASLVSIVVSNNDQRTLDMLKRHAFISGERHELYITQLEGPVLCEQGFAPMSYLDTDLGLAPWAEELK